MSNNDALRRLPPLSSLPWTLHLVLIAVSHHHILCLNSFFSSLNLFIVTTAWPQCLGIVL